MDENFFRTPQNSLTYWRQSLSETVISSVRWVNLPDGIDPLFLEKALFNNGKVIFFTVTDEKTGKKTLVCSNGVGTADYNLYGIPYKRTVVAPNGFTAELNADNSVICYNSVLQRAENPRCEYYAKRIALYDSIIDGNAKAQRTPFFLQASEADKLSLENLYNQIASGAPVIKATDALNPDGLKVFQTSAIFNGLALRDLQKQIITEYFTLNGIFHNTPSSERALVAEIATENYAVEMNQRAKLLPRQEAARLINEKFGELLEKPIEVKFEEGITAADYSGNLAESERTVTELV